MKDAVARPGSRICCLLFTRGSLIPILPTPPRIPGGEVKRSESPQPPQAGCDLLASASPQASGRRVFPSSPRPSSLQKLLAIHGALLNTLSPTVPAHTPCDVQAVVPSTSGSRARFRGRQCFHRWGAARGWFLDDPSALQLLCPFFLFCGHLRICGLDLKVRVHAPT